MLLKCQEKPADIYKMHETLGGGAPPQTPLGELTARSPRHFIVGGDGTNSTKAALNTSD